MLFSTHTSIVSQARTGTDEVVGRATYLAKKLWDFKVLRFMHFLQDLLEILSRLSLALQRVDVTVVTFLDALETTNLEMIVLGQGPGEHLQEFLDSVTMEDNTAKFKGTPLLNFQVDMAYDDLQAVIELVMDSVNRRLENWNVPTLGLLRDARIFDTKVWPDNQEGLGPFGNQEIIRIADSFQVILDRNGCERGQLAREWIQVKAHIGAQFLKQDVRNRPLFSNLHGQQENRDRFKNILHIHNLVTTLPVSSATCERGFSCLKRVKNDWGQNSKPACWTTCSWCAWRDHQRRSMWLTRPSKGGGTNNEDQSGMRKQRLHPLHRRT